MFFSWHCTCMQVWKQYIQRTGSNWECDCVLPSHPRLYNKFSVQTSLTIHNVLKSPKNRNTRKLISILTLAKKKKKSSFIFKGLICFNYIAFPETSTASIMNCWIKCRSHWMKLYCWGNTQLNLLPSPRFKHSYLHHIFTLFYWPATAAGQTKRRSKTQAWWEPLVAMSWWLDDLWLSKLCTQLGGLALG